MARTSSAKVSNQGRSTIKNPNLNTNKDDGTVLISIIEGEELKYRFTFNWMTGTRAATDTATFVIKEANNNGDGTVPTAERVGGARREIAMSYVEGSDPFQFDVEIPNSLTTTTATGQQWNTSVSPSPEKPIYGFFGIEVTDGDQIWKPVRGLLEILYSPTH